METDSTEAGVIAASGGHPAWGPWASALTRLSRDVLVATDMHCRILHWPPEAETLLGWPPARAQGFGLGTVLSLPPAVMSTLRSHLATDHAVVDQRLPARRMGGARCDLLIDAAQVDDEQGVPQGYLFRLVDLQADKATTPWVWLEKLLDQIPLPMALADASGQMRFANPLARELFQLETGQACCDGPCILSPSGCRNQQTLAGRLTSYWEIKLRGQSIDMTAIPVALLGTAPDHVLYLGVPSQPHLSPELRKFFRAVDENPSAILITNPLGQIEYTNPRATEILGYSPVELINRSVTELARTPGDIVLNPSQPSLAHTSLETTLICQNGSSRPVRMALADIRGDNGEVSNWVVMIDDLSARRALEASEQRLREQVARSAQLAAVGEITTMIAHEINQPLNCISNFSQGLLHRLRRGAIEPEALRDSLEEIRLQVGRVDSVIKNVRNLARQSSATLDATQINDVIQQARACFDLLAKGSGVRVRIDGDPDLEAVRMEKTQIEQVLINLVKNAIEASKAEAVDNAEVVIRTLASARGGVRVEVEDHASLPDADTLARLGEPFFTTKAEGLGLGLSISRTLLENHGSHLEISPLSTGGKVFHFELEHLP